LNVSHNHSFFPVKCQEYVDLVTSTLIIFFIIIISQELSISIKVDVARNFPAAGGAW
jgi:hypothetical protein